MTSRACLGSEFRADSIVNMDCVKALSKMPGDCIDLVVTSPPYDNIRDYKGRKSLDLSGLGRELNRVAKPGGVVAVVIADATRARAKTLTTFRLAVDWCDNAGWSLFESVIYHRHGRPGAWWSKRFRVDHEYILLFSKGPPKHFDKADLMIPSAHAGRYFEGTQRLTSGDMAPIERTQVKGMKCRGTVWFYSTSNTERNPTKMQHPATYPDALVRDLVHCFTEPGDVVLDPMCGSGTTCVVAAQEGRRYLGIDVVEEYCCLAEERLAAECRVTANDIRVS